MPNIFGIRTDASLFNKIGGLFNWSVIGAAVAAIATGHAPTVTVDLSTIPGAVTSAAVMALAEAYRRSHHGERK